MIVRRNFLKQQGLSLIEVLVTMVIVAVGLLGIAGLQLSSLKLGMIAENRSTGVIAVSTLLDRMRSNIGNVGSYAIAYGAAPPTGTTQADVDVANFKTQIAAFLPNGDARVTIAQGDATSCVVPVAAKCWDVRVELRWDESNAKGGQAGATQKFMDISSRL
jgi:type IV pilus assembly protein PilV